jgi:hypothetical protein
MGLLVQYVNMATRAEGRDNEPRRTNDSTGEERHGSLFRGKDSIAHTHTRAPTLSHISNYTSFATIAIYNSSLAVKRKWTSSDVQFAREAELTPK